MAQFCESIGRPLLDWQRVTVERLLEIRGDGRLRFRFALLIVGRQCGKSELASLIALFWIYRRKARLVVGTAQTLDIAREVWLRAGDIIEESGGVLTEPRFYASNGKERCVWPDGARWLVKAANRRLRGLSPQLVLVDELREQTDFEAWQALTAMTLAQPEGLVLALSSAGESESSVVLNALQAKGRADAADPGYSGDLFLGEYSAPPGSDIDDPHAWAFGMPSIGHTVSLAAVEGLRSTLPPAAFRTEVMGMTIARREESVISAEEWEACADRAGTLDSARTRLAVCIDVSPDGHTSLAVAGQARDGVVRVELAATWSSPTLAREELAGLLARIAPRKVGWFGPASPAAALAGDLRASAGDRLVKLDAAEACATFQSLVTGGRRLRHGGQTMLDQHVSGATRAPRGQGWVFARRQGGQAVDAAYSAAGAVLLARQLTPPSSAKLIVAA